MEKNEISVKIKRGDTHGQWMAEYNVPFADNQSVLQVLKKINENYDPSLAFYSSCRIGKCGLCRMIINGKLSLACTTLADKDLIIEPDPSGHLIRDLLVTLDNR